MALARRMLDDAGMRSLIPALLATAALAGCYATTSGGYYGGGGVSVTATTVEPDLVYVSPGVQVIADYDEPIFYSDGFYWRETNGTWYRSHQHTGGWIYASPPQTVISIGSRQSYRNYRPSGYVRRDHRQQQPVYRDNRPVVRDHRQAPQPVYRNNQQPVVRDHRQPAQPVRQAPPTTRDHRNDDDDKNKRDHRH